MLKSLVILLVPKKDKVIIPYLYLSFMEFVIFCFAGLCCFHGASAGRAAPEELLQHGWTRPYCHRLQ